MAPSSKFPRPREFLNRAHFLASKHCDDPTRQVILHLAWVFGLSGEGLDSYKKIERSGHDLDQLYQGFVKSARISISRCIKTDRPIPDYIGAFVARNTVDRYETQEFCLTPTEVVHQKNKTLLHPDEHGKRFVETGEVGAYEVEGLTPQNMVPLFDPTMGTGRVGMDAVCYHPTATYWGIERDLDTYRVAVLSGRLIAPFCRGSVAGHPATRWSVLWADSLVIDVRDAANWERGMNKWDPPDWQVYSRAQGHTWADLQRVLEEGNVDSREGANKGGTDMGTAANGLPQSRFPEALPTPTSQ